MLGRRTGKSEVERKTSLTWESGGTNTEDPHNYNEVAGLHRAHYIQSSPSIFLHTDMFCLNVRAGRNTVHTNLRLSGIRRSRCC